MKIFQYTCRSLTYQILLRADHIITKSPRTVGAFGKSSRKDVELKLSLPIVGSGPQQQNTAEMDPWLNVIEEFDLVETMTARIISQ